MRRPRPSSFALLTLLLMLAPARPAVGERLPEPISGPELSSYADVLGLSPQQRLAIEPFYETYREQQEQLEAAEIRPFIDAFGRFGGDWLRGQPALLEETLTQHGRALDRIAALDRRLLDQVQTVLSEEQTPLLERVRDARRRVRCSAVLKDVFSLAWRSPAAFCDLPALVRQLELPPGERERLDPVMRQHEQELTADLCRQHQQALQALRQMVARTWELRTASMREQVLPMAALYEEIVERSMQISDLNLRTLRTILPLLPDETGHRLHERYFSEAYREFPSRPLPADRAFERALASEALAGDLRAAVLGVREDYHQDLHRISGKAAELVDAQRRARGLIHEADDPEDEQALADLIRQRQARSSEATTTLAALLGPELASHLSLDQRDDDGSVDRQSSDGAAAGAGSPDIAASEAEVLDAVAALLPPPITTAELEVYARWLGLDEPQREIAAALHRDYVHGYDALRREQARAIQQARLELWSLDGDDAQDGSHAEELVEHLHAMRRSAMAALQGQDELLLGDLAALLPEARRTLGDRVRLARRREVYPVAIAAAGIGAKRELRELEAVDMSGRKMVELLHLLDAIDTTGADPEALEEAMSTYEHAVTPMWARAWQAMAAFARELEKFEAASGGRRASPQRTMDARETNAVQGKAAAQALAKVDEQSRASLRQIAALLPAEAAAQLEHAYDMAAFPSIFKPWTGLRYIETALELPDLSWEQRRTLQDLLVQFRAGHQAYVRGMVEVLTGPGNSGYDSPDETAERGRRLQELISQSSERFEQIRVRVRALLSEEQARAVGLEE